jgi:hypothetical protein
VPLIAESTGRLRHGKQELCPAGEIVRVVVERQPGDPEGGAQYEYRLFVELTSNYRVRLPSLFFNFDCKAEAAWLAEQLGDALQTKVDYESRDRRSFWG